MRVTVSRTAFEALVQAATAFGNEVRVECASTKAVVHGTDESREGWVEVTLRDDVFTSGHEVGGEELAFNIGEVGDVVGVTSDDANVLLSLDTEARRVTAHAQQLRYARPLILPGSVPRVLMPRSPDRPVRIELPGDALSPAVELADPIATHMTFCWDGDTRTFRVSAAGMDESVRAEFLIDDAAALPDGRVTTEVALDRLASIQNAILDDATLQIAFGRDTSIRFSYAFADGNGQAVFTLRPTY